MDRKRNKTLTSCVWSLVLLSALPSGFAQPNSKSDASPPRNCIDSSIIEFCRRMGRDVSSTELIQAIKSCELPPSAFYRSLADCERILAELGVSVTAIPIKIEEDALMPSLGIYYCKSLNPEFPGHVLVISSDDEGELTIYDPGAKVEVYHRNIKDIREPFDTIVLMTDSIAWKMSFASFASLFLKIFAIGILLAFVCQIVLKRRQNKKTSSVSATLACFLLAFTAGCQQETPSGDSLLFAETVHDFEVLHPESSSYQAQYTFRLKNPYRHPITITSIVAGCSCVTPGKELEGQVVDSKESIDIPISINLQRKFGQFHENILVNFASDEVARELLILRGFVIHHPKPVSEQVLIEALKDRATMQDAEVAYVRTSHTHKSRVRAYHLESEDGKSHERFTVQDPILSSGMSNTGGIVDIWRFPVTYDPPPSGEKTRARLHIYWNTPAAETVVNLVGVHLQPLDIEDYIYLPRVPIDEEFTERVPFKVFDPDIVEHLEVASNHPGISCKLFPKKKLLELKAKLLNTGQFQAIIDFKHNSQILFSIKVDGNATSS